MGVTVLNSGGQLRGQLQGRNTYLEGSRTQGFRQPGHPQLACSLANSFPVCHEVPGCSKACTQVHLAAPGTASAEG